VVAPVAGNPPGERAGRRCAALPCKQRPRGSIPRLSTLGVGEGGIPEGKQALRPESSSTHRPSFKWGLGNILGTSPSLKM